jgi:hypothetical protein
MTRLAFAALLLATPAWAQQPPPPCGSRALVVAKLLEKFGETQQSAGLQTVRGDPVAAFEVYANDETGTWTLLRSEPNGMACLMAAGRDWNETVEPVGEPS